MAGPRGKDPQAPEADRNARPPARPSASGRLADALRRALDDPDEAPRAAGIARAEPSPPAGSDPVQRVAGSPSATTQPTRAESSPVVMGAPPAVPAPTAAYGASPPLAAQPSVHAAALPALALDAAEPLDDGDDAEEIIDESLIDSPDKLYFRIGEVAQLVGVDAHVLRYWESEFRMKPRRSPSGQRLYRRSDLAKFLRIKSLLHDEGYTIAGARKVLNGALGAPTVDPSRLKAALDRVRALRRLIREIQDELDLDNQT